MFATLPTIVDLGILLVVVHAIILTTTNLLKMKMTPATCRFSYYSNFATQVLIAIVHRVVVVVVVLFSRYRDYPFLVGVRELQACELHVENHLDLTCSWISPSLSLSTSMFSYFDRSFDVATYDVSTVAR